MRLNPPPELHEEISLKSGHKTLAPFKTIRRIALLIRQQKTVWAPPPLQRVLRKRVGNDDPHCLPDS